MILELADLRIHAGQEAAFEEAIMRGLARVSAGAKGFRAMVEHFDLLGKSTTE